MRRRRSLKLGSYMKRKWMSHFKMGTLVSMTVKKRRTQW